MKAIKNTSFVLSTLTAAALLSGCGSSGVTGNPSAVSQPQDNGQVVVPVDQGAGYAAYPLSFKTVGGSAPVASMPLNTDNLLKVKVTLDPATRNENTPVYTNFTANYSCATVKITLQVEQNGVYVTLPSVVTNRLTAAGTSGCAGSVAEQTIDFSAYMTPGHGKVKVTAQALSSNFNCLAAQQYPFNYPAGYYANVCSSNPMQSIYQYHVVNGKLEVQVNGTGFIN